MAHVEIPDELAGALGRIAGVERLLVGLDFDALSAIPQVIAAAGVDADAVRAFVRTELARHKVPRDVVFVGELPRNATGKLPKTELRAQFDLPDFDYGRILAPLDGFAAALREFIAQGGVGCNITMPFKEDAFRASTRVTERAAAAGVVNTIQVETDGTLLGDNTDGAGLVADLLRHRSLNSTLIYAKLDTPKLAAVALPWPGSSE